LSSLALFGLAYFLLSVTLQQQDRAIIESELKLYASRYETAGLDAIIAEINARHRESLFVRVAGPRNQTLLQHIPVEWNEFAFKQLEVFGIVAMIVFILLLVDGLAYAWRKGDLEWA